jgi:membrane protein required for colicin V production
VSGADWVILAAILASVIQAASQGFFQTAFGIAGLIVGYLLAAWHYWPLSQWIAPHVRSSWIGDIVGFLAIFLAVTLAAAVIGRVARWIVKESGLRGFDRVLGAVLGALRGGFIVAVVLMGMAAFAPTASWLQGSQLAPYFLVAGRAAIWVAPSDLRARFYQGLDVLRQAHQPAAPEFKRTAH